MDTKGTVGREATDDGAESACAYANSVFERGKRRRLGRLSRPGKAYFFAEGIVVKLSGTPFQDRFWDTEDHYRYALPVFAQALDAWAVLNIVEAWGAHRCASCGAHDDGQFRRGHCDTCGADAVEPKDNPHRREALIGQL